jgi:hypothetical protein
MTVTGSIASSTLMMLGAEATHLVDAAKRHGGDKQREFSNHLSTKTTCSLIGSRATWSLLAGKSGSG